MPAATDPLQLAELLCARISHDLSGMIGTLVGALELADDTTVAAEAVALAQQTATELRQRMELQRACWGPQNAPLTLPMLRSLVEGMPHGRRCTIEFGNLPASTEFSPAFGRIVLNLLLLAADSLSGSGSVILAGSARDLVVAIVGPRAAWPRGLPACLADEAAAWAALTDARSLQMPLTILLAHRLGLRLSLLLGGRENAPPPLRLQEV